MLTPPHRERVQMSQPSALIIGGSSMLTPIGAGVEMVKSSIDAGMNNFQLYNIFDEENNDIKMSLVPTMAINQGASSVDGEFTSRQMRMMNLAQAALADLSPQLPDQAIPLFLSGPQPYVNVPGIDGAFMHSLVDSSGLNIDKQTSRYVSMGRAGAIDVIETAFKYMSFAENHFAIVGGVDSFCDYRTIQYLYERYRVFRPGAYDGFIPGEAAAFVLLVSPNAPKEIVSTLTHYVYRPVSAFEKGHLLGNEPYRGDALSDVFDGVLKSVPHKVSHVYSSENGEMHYAKELSVAMIRNHQKINKERQTHRPAEFVGDVGSALGIISLALSNTQNYQNEHAVIYCSSDSGQRAGLCVSSRTS